MLADTLEHVDEIVVRIEFMQSTGRNQALDDADMLGAELGPAEHPVMKRVFCLADAAHGDRAVSCPYPATGRQKIPLD